MEQDHLLAQELILGGEFLSGSKSVSECTKANAGGRPSSGTYPTLKKPTELADATAQRIEGVTEHKTR